MRTTKKAFSILLALLMLALTVPFAFAASGTDGNLNWSYDETTKTLTVSGSGEMLDHFYDYPAWDPYHEEATAVVIEDGVTSIGECAFFKFTALESVTIPSSVQSIGEAAFYICTALKTVNYSGSEEDWNNIEKGEDIFMYKDEATGVILPIDCTFNYNYVEPQPEDPGTTPEEPQPDPNLCHWCGKVHEGFFQSIIGWFHGILAKIFGNKY